MAFDELAGVAFDELLLLVYPVQVFQADAMHVPHRLYRSLAIALAPAERGRGAPVGVRRLSRQELLHAGEQLARLLDQFIRIVHAGILTRRSCPNSIPEKPSPPARFDEALELG